MYGITQDMTFLIGKTILGIDPSEFICTIVLSDDLTISVESDVLVDSEPANVDCLTGLIGATILSANVANEAVLALHLSNGALLTILDSNKSFESFTIDGPGICIVV